MAIDSFSDRMDGARKKEDADETTLRDTYGCVVTKFGQGQLSNDIRHYLHQHANCLPLRWLPDRLAIRPALFHAGFTEWMWLVDSKYSRKYNAENSSRYDHWLIEQAAHTAHRLQRTALGLPIVYIWPDGTSCSYVEDLTNDVLIPSNYYGYGSGTPAWMFPKEKTRTLDEVFGKGIIGKFARG